MNLSKLSPVFAAVADRYPTALANVECYAICGPGWLPAIIPVLEICEAQGVRVVQIKEKFGGLRIYANDAGNQAVRDAIREAETACWKICEECGEPGTRRAGGWVRTLCDGCHS
jgi:hypothetical protein